MTTMTVTTAAPSPAAAAPAQAPAAAPASAPAAAPAAAPATETTTPVETTIGDAPAAAAPAAAPAQAPEAPAADSAPAVIQYEPSGDPGLDLALSYIGQRGIGPDHPAMEAAAKGDFSLLKAHLATMGDKAPGWEHVIAAGEAAYGRQQEASKAAAAKTQDTILGAFGYDAAKPETREAAAKEWGAVQEWAKANADPHEKVQVNAALAAGGIAAKAMAQYLGGLFRQHPSAEYTPTTVTQIGGRAPGSDGGYALSPAQYQVEVNKLVATKRGAIDNTPEYKELQARRMAWKAPAR